MPKKRKYYTHEEAVEARRIRDSARNVRRIDIGDENIGRWQALGGTSRLNDQGFARLLLDKYAASVSGIEVSTQTESGLEDIAMRHGGDPYHSEDEVDALSLERDDIMEIESETVPEQSYVPYNESMFDYRHAQMQNERTYNLENMEVYDPADLVHPLPDQAPDDTVDEAAFRLIQSHEEVLDETPCVVYLSCLMTLAPQLLCPQCGTKCSVQHKFIGSATVLLWVCENSHTVRQWSSQPLLKKHGLSLGDFMMSANILLSGNSFCKIALLARFMGMRIVSYSAFLQIQRLYCVPAIESFWEEVNSNTLNELHGQEVVVCGDGRNDSPGHSAQCCTYTVMKHDTNKILTLQTVDMREVDLKSPNMEHLGCKRALEFLRTSISVTEFVSDAHVQILTMLRNEYPEITIQLDPWHGAKRLIKELHAAADQKANSALKEWIPDIINHFWYCCSKADGSIEAFLGRWQGILHHITGKHEWREWYVSHPACEHERMDEPTDGKTWLEPGSRALHALGHIIMDETLLHNLPMYTRFRHTNALETFHQHILMYAPKRLAFSPPVYRARNILAALDFQLHADCILKTKEDGSVVYKRMYNKRTATWYAMPVKEAKGYDYINSLLLRILEASPGATGATSQVVS